jgi:RNA polymerase sigma-70 factor, ECF subfamily
VNARDKELLELARKGDAAAVDELLRRHERKVFRFGLRMCGSEEEAKDVLQQTLVAALQRVHQFRGEAELSTWLYQLARTYCLRSRRKPAGAPREHLSLGDAQALEVAAEGQDPEQAAHARHMAEVIEAALLTLPDPHREVLVLRDVEGLTANEAAQVVGIEVPALKSRLHRARAELRESLKVVLGEAGTTGRICPELAQQLEEYALEGTEIDRTTCEVVEAHLASCDSCRQECDRLKRAVTLCRRLPGDEVPGPVRQAVRRAMIAAVGQAPPAS